MATATLCKIDGCGKPTKACGYCSAHYERLRLHGDPLGLTPRQGREMRLCSVDGCGRKHYGRGLCGMHFGRWKRTGDPLRRDRKDAAVYFTEVVLPYRGDECLIWPFYRNPDGRGRISHDGKDYIASRLVCEIVNGAPPDPTFEAAHSCGNGHLGCVTPNHVRWLSHLDNQAEMVAHGTSARGERSGHAKLNSSDVRQIRYLAQATSQKELAARFGVSTGHISRIVSRKEWPWLDA